MTTLFKIKLTAIILLTAGSLSLRADSISGSYSNDCTALIKLWDLSGSYDSTNEDQGQTEVDKIVLTMDATGAISGTGHFDIVDVADDTTLSADFTATGKVSSAGTVTRVKLTFVAPAGTGNVQGRDVTFQAKLNENLEIDDNSRMLVGTSSGKVKVTVPSLGVTKSKPVPSSPTSENLPDEVDGGWGLSLTTSADDKNKYSGGSALTLSNGKTFDLAVSGSYSSKTDQSKIALKSTDKTAPIALNLVEQNLGSSLSILSLKGKALGQKLQFKQ